VQGVVDNEWGHKNMGSQEKFEKKLAKSYDTFSFSLAIYDK